MIDPPHPRTDPRIARRPPAERRVAARWRRWALLAASAALLSGCGARVLGANPEGIWFREPFVGTGGAEAAAREHCAAYDKTAVYKGTLTPAQGYALPVIAYDCR